MLNEEEVFSQILDVLCQRLADEEELNKKPKDADDNHTTEIVRKISTSSILINNLLLESEKDQLNKQVLVCTLCLLNENLHDILTLCYNEKTK